MPPMKKGPKAKYRGVPMANSQSKRHEPRASIACVQCRSRKVKCDVEAIGPGSGCTPCHDLDVQCIVSHQDLRRCGAREHLAAVNARLRSLERLLQTRKIEPNYEASLMQAGGSPISSPALVDWQSLSSRISTQLEPPSKEPAMTAKLPSATTDRSSGQAGTSSPGISWTTGPTSTIPLSLDAASQDTHQLSMLTVNNADATQCNLKVTPGLFGPVHGTLPPLQAASTPISPSFPADMLSCIDINRTPDLHHPRVHTPYQKPASDPSFYGAHTRLIDPNSPQIQRRLLDTTWQYLALQPKIVHRDGFLASFKTNSKSDYCSKLLQNAIFACISRLSNSAAVRRLGIIYYNNAKQEVMTELGKPTLATLSGLLLLADFAMGQCEDQLGWTFVGMAARFLGDIHFCQGPETLISAHTPIPDELWRSTLLASIFVYDTLWSLQLGRPRTVSLSNMRAILCSKKEDRMVKEWLDLCFLVAQANDLLTTLLPPDLTSVSQLTELDVQIQRTYEALPGDLCYDRTPGSLAELDASAYSFHMQFYSFKIVLHRALVGYCVNGADNTAPRFPTTHAPLSWNTMYESAVCVADLAITYAEIFGPNQVITLMLNNIYLATITLINHALVLQHQAASIEGDTTTISLLGGLLSQLQSYYPAANRMCYALTHILGDTPLAFLAPYFQPQEMDAASGDAGSWLDNSPWVLMTDQMNCSQFGATARI